MKYYLLILCFILNVLMAQTSINSGFSIGSSLFYFEDRLDFDLTRKSNVFNLAYDFHTRVNHKKMWAEIGFNKSKGSFQEHTTQKKPTSFEISESYYSFSLNYWRLLVGGRLLTRNKISMDYGAGIETGKFGFLDYTPKTINKTYPKRSLNTNQLGTNLSIIQSFRVNYNVKKSVQLFLKNDVQSAIKGFQEDENTNLLVKFSRFRYYPSLGVNFVFFSK